MLPSWPEMCLLEHPIGYTGFGRKKFRQFTISSSDLNCMSEARKFSEVFCKIYGCDRGNFEKEMFWRCVYRISLPLSALVFWLKPKYFNPEFALIRQLGVCQSTREFRSEVKTYQYETHTRGGFLRDSCKVRLSSQLLKAQERKIRRLIEEQASA